MKRSKKKTKNKKLNSASFILAVVIISFMVLSLFLVGCAEPQPVIQKVNVEVPCEVNQIPQSPRYLDLENATIAQKQVLIKEAVQYAKEVAPIMRECVREKRIKGKKSE